MGLEILSQCRPAKVFGTLNPANYCSQFLVRRKEYIGRWIANSLAERPRFKGKSRDTIHINHVGSTVLLHGWSVSVKPIFWIAFPSYGQSVWREIHAFPCASPRLLPGRLPLLLPPSTRRPIPKPFWLCL